MLSPKQRQALFVELHKEIERSAAQTAATLVGGVTEYSPTYPPNGGLSDSERQALARLPKDPAAQSALRKIVADAIATTVFNFFTLVDGAADPEQYDEHWPGFQLSPNSLEQPEDSFLHNDFHETYWVWRSRRPDPGWKLDIYEGNN
jgi:hypothetical protein